MKSNRESRTSSSPPAARAVLLAALVTTLAACAGPPVQKTAAEHQASLPAAEERQMTLGLVQSSIKEGMPQSEVAAALGSPNIVTVDAAGNDVWIYDKISTETAQSSSSTSQSNSTSGGILAGGISGTLGAVLGVGGSTASGASDRSGASSRTQRTLTVVIKFDENSKVASVKSQASSF